MVLICTIVTLLMSASMFFISRERKVALIFVAIMCLSLLRIGSILYSSTILVIAFCTSELKNISRYYNEFMHHTQLKRVFIILALLFILDVILSPHLHNLNKFLGYFNRFWLTGFFFLFIPFLSVKTEKDFMVIVRYAMIGMAILTIFGLANYIQKRSDFVTEMLSNQTNLVSFMQVGGNLYTNASRFRVQSMFQNPFDYGYICLCFLIICIYCKDKIKRNQFWIMVICCIFGILTCNCRTIIVCLLLGISTFILFAYGIRKTTFVLLCAFTILPLVYIFIPEFANKADALLTTFTNEQYEEGSSITMRTVQFLTTLKYIEDNPLFGNGVYFFDIDLGWAETSYELRSKLLDRDLWGLEGVYLKYLMEHGWLGYILYTAVWVILLFYLLHYRNTHRKIVALGISIWTIYFVFANMTGELKSIPPTLIVLGCILGITSINRRT